MLLLVLTGPFTGCDTVGPEEDFDTETEDLQADSLFVEGVQARTDPSSASLATDRAHWADGYVWGENFIDYSYTPDPWYTFNRTGGATEIIKPAGTTGRYLVRFTGLSNLLNLTSTVHVSGHSYNESTYCKPVSPKLVNDVVEVRCFDASSGAAANSAYTVLLTRNYADLAYAHGNKPTANDYAPPVSSSWNPQGPIRIFKTGIGSYRVRFFRMGRDLPYFLGHVQVSAVGMGGNYCKVKSWGGTPDLDVNVKCYNKSGSLVNTKFNVLFLMPSDRLGYALADQPSSPNYTPNPVYSWNAGGYGIGITRYGTGSYVVNFHGLDPEVIERGNAQVTAYGSGNAQCRVFSTGPEYVGVRCFRPDGSPVDAPYTVLLGS